MIIRIYITLIPVIIAGILNMLFVKTSLYKKYKSPIDKGKILRDGKRLFGENKTWIGFAGMMLMSIISQVIWGLLNNIYPYLNSNNYFYINNNNTILFNIYIGALLGFAYVLFELPNSFIKRRLGIDPGKTKNALSFIVDQIDSLFGVILVLALFYKITISEYFIYVFIGGATHIVINLLLYGLKIKKNI
jgi:CDP-diglyceride synthetase